jgi:hypothetical protein
LSVKQFLSIFAIAAIAALGGCAVTPATAVDGLQAAYGAAATA